MLRSNSFSSLVDLEANNARMSDKLRRRRGSSVLIPVVVIRGGGPLSILVMSFTVGGMLLLLLIQGYISLSWFGGSHDFHRRHDAKLLLDLQRNLRGPQTTVSLEQVRSDFLKTLQAKEDTSICSLLPKSYKKHPENIMMQLWMRYIGVIMTATQHPDDADYTHEDWTKKLLAELPPSSLQSSLHIRPPASIIERIVEIIRQRLLHPDTASPLRIAVVGGAITEGAGCEEASVAIPDGSIMANPTYCAWPYRLEAFLNNLLGPNVVQVVNMAEEGTDTGFMTPLVKNWIYPASLLPDGPDIIVNAYGRFDYATYQEGDPSASLEETIKSELTSFRRAVETSHPCGHAPLVVHLDDVTLNLKDHSNLFSIRHSDVVNRVLRVDPPNGNSLFSMAGHVGMTWVVAYSLIEAVVQHCASPGPTISTSEALVASPRRNATDCQDPSTGEASCPFAFFASPMGTVRKVPEVQRYIKPFVILNEGWQVLSDMSTGWSRKTGLVAVASDAKIFFKVSNITKEVRYFHLMSLKSNGERWQNGKAEFRLAILPNGEASQAMETTFMIDGYHESDKHITYHFTLDFEDNKAPVGSDIVMSVELVQGTSFKILGMMLCS
jgi:hypothetical protein